MSLWFLPCDASWPSEYFISTAGKLRVEYSLEQEALPWEVAFPLRADVPSSVVSSHLIELAIQLLLAYSFVFGGYFDSLVVGLSLKIGKWDGYQVACGPSQTSSWNQLALRWICFSLKCLINQKVNYERSCAICECFLVSLISFALAPGLLCVLVGV